MRQRKFFCHAASYISCALNDIALARCARGVNEQWRIFQQWDSQETVMTTQHGIDDQMPALAPSQPEGDVHKGTLARNRNVSLDQITPGAFVNHLDSTALDLRVWIHTFNI